MSSLETVTQEHRPAGVTPVALEFAGCVAVISHDRWFLDRIATHILACEGDSKWTFFDGNYQEYEADKRKRLGDNQRLSERCLLA